MTMIMIIWNMMLTMIVYLLLRKGKNGLRPPEMTSTTVKATSSYSPSISHEERTGSSFVTDLLLHNHMSGITASPFICNIETLQQSVSLRHCCLWVITGCVQGPDKNDRTACRHFAQGFTSPQESGDDSVCFWCHELREIKSSAMRTWLFPYFEFLSLTHLWHSPRIRMSLSSHCDSHILSIFYCISSINLL